MSYGDPSTNPYQTSTPGYMPPPQPQGSPVLAIISLVCGVLGVVTTCCCSIFGLPVPIIAIVCGGIALAQPNSSGKGMAIAGVVLGVLCVLLAIVLLIIGLANPEFGRQFQDMQQFNK
ncbi:MAG: DUF4190 domain-containing protein [Pirellulaceae bacterium]